MPEAPSREADDSDLVARLARGEEAALAALMRRHGSRLRQIARRMTGRSDEAEDIVQESFVAIWRRRGELDADPARFAAYATRTVVNRCIDHGRRQRLKRWIGLEAAPEPEDEGPSAADAVEARSEMAAVLRDLRKLPARQRAAILLASSEERSMVDIAEILGVSVGAAEQLLVRARRTLRLGAMSRSTDEAAGA